MANELFPGSQAVVYVEKETSYDSNDTKMTAANAMFTISETFTGGEEREVRPDRSGSADHTERFRGRKNADFEITKLLLPNGSVTTQPDDTYLWENLFGNLSMNTTAIEYIFATAHTDSLTIRRGIRSGGSAGSADLQEHLRGAIVNRGAISWGAAGNNGLGQVGFGGMAKEYGFTGNTSIGSGYTTLDLNTGRGSFRVANAKQLTVGSIVQILGATPNSGGGSGILITSLNQTTSLAKGTFSGAPASSGRAVKPFNPAPVTAGSPIHGRLGSLSLDASASLIKHLGGTITIEDNRMLLNEEVGLDSASRVLRTERRNCTFSLDFLIDKDNFGTLMGDMLANTSKNVQLTIGSDANKKFRFVMSNAEWDFTSLDVPDQDMVRVSMSGRALGTNGNDSVKLRIL